MTRGLHDIRENNEETHSISKALPVEGRSSMQLLQPSPDKDPLRIRTDSHGGSDKSKEDNVEGSESPGSFKR